MSDKLLTPNERFEKDMQRAYLVLAVITGLAIVGLILLIVKLYLLRPLLAP
jgi:hypothetical protein